MISFPQCTITDKITSFLDEKVFLSKPHDHSQFQTFRIRDFIQPFLSSIQCSQEIQDACTKIEASITGSYLANQVTKLHPIVNDKDVKIQFFVKPGTDKSALYEKIHALARKHLINQVFPQARGNFDCPLVHIGAKKDVYNPDVKGMGLGSIELYGDWGQAPLECSILLLDQPSFTHLTNVDSLYVPLQVFGDQLGSESPGQFLLRSREKGDLQTILSDLKNRVITSCKTDWDPAQLSHYELARYFIWIVEKWTESGSSIFSNFAIGSLNKAKPRDLWISLSNKVREKRSTFASYPFFLLCNFLFHFTNPEDPSLLQTLENEFNEILYSLPYFSRVLHPILYFQEKVSGRWVSKLRPDALFLLSYHLPILAQKVSCKEHLGRKFLQCSFSEQDKDFSIMVPIPKDRIAFKEWISRMCDHGRPQWVLHILYQMQNEILDCICQSFYAGNEEGSAVLNWFFSIIPARKRPIWTADLISRYKGENLSFILSQSLRLLSIPKKKIFLKALAENYQNLFFRLLPDIQADLSISRKTILSYLIGHIDSPSFYTTYIEMIDTPSEKRELLEYIFSCKNEERDIPILRSCLSLLPQTEKMAFLAQFLSKKDLPLWNTYLSLLVEGTDYVDLMQQLFYSLDEERFFVSLERLQQCFPEEKKIEFMQAVITRLLPILEQTPISFQKHCMKVLGNGVENWLYQVFLCYGEGTFFQAISWSFSLLHLEQKEVCMKKLLTCFYPNLANLTQSFWEQLAPTLLPLVSDKKSWREMVFKLLMNLSVFPPCFIPLVEKCGLNNSATAFTSPKPFDVSLKKWMLDLKLSALYKNSLYIQYSLIGELSKEKLGEIRSCFPLASLLKPVFDDLLEKGLWNEAAHFLRNLKTVYADEVLSWYVDYARKNPKSAKTKESHCLKVVKDCWQMEKAWDYYEALSFFPHVVAYLISRGFPDPSNLSIEKKQIYASKICSSLKHFKIQDALSLAMHLPSLDAQEETVAQPLLHLFEKCQTKEQRVQTANLIQKLAPSLTIKLVNRFKDPYIGALREPLPVSSSFSLDQWMLAFLEACLDEVLIKQKVIFSWMTQKMDQFLRKFPVDFPVLARKYAKNVSIEEKQAFISVLKRYAGTKELESLLQEMALSL